MSEIGDIFGIKPYGEALKIAVEKSANGAGKYLAAICLPAAEEFGQLMKDKLRYWRLNNIIKMIELSKNKFEFKADKLEMKVNPRIGVDIIESASWQSDEEILEMWAGLLLSSLNEDETDDSNLLFINMLKSLSSVQCKMLNHICSNSIILYDKNGLIYSKKSIELKVDELIGITNCNDIQRLDREMDHLRAMELLDWSLHNGDGGGFVNDQEDFSKVTLRPSSLSLNLFSRSNGYNSVKDCFEK